MMRRAIMLGAALTGVLGVTGSAAGEGRLSAVHSSIKMIEYRGLRIPVPAGWPVYWLDKDPRRCVRFDQHAVYLGRAGADQDCPARLVGRTEAIQIEPADVPAGGRESQGAPAQADRTRAIPVGGLAGPADVTREVRLTVPGTGMQVTATYDAEPGAITSMLAASGLGSAVLARPGSSAAQRPAGDTGRPWRRRWTTGDGFDTCGAPSLRAMRAWRDAFKVTNIYLGGASRACGDGNLSEYWVRSVRRMGWRLIPTYVGLQAPCTRYHNKIDPSRAGAQGARSADNAIDRARGFGLPRGVPIYFDIEAYDSGNKKCRGAVLSFLNGWSRRLNSLGYASGVYSSVASGIRDLGRATGIKRPAAIWYAHWDKRANLRGSEFFPGHMWFPHRRIKQHRGGHKEKHGGVTLHIDSDTVDGLVY